MTTETIKIAHAIFDIIYEYKKVNNIHGYERVDFENVITWAVSQKRNIIKK